jgi:hypothetical protein
LFHSIIFFLSLALTAGSMIMERKEGMQERCLVLGKYLCLSCGTYQRWNYSSRFWHIWLRF